MLKRSSQNSPLFLAEVLKRDANNFDLLRLIAAIGVIIGHAHAIAPQPPLKDFVLGLVGFDYSSSLAVNFFFFLSGLFLADSLLRQMDPLKMLIRRSFRIFPGLLLCLMVSIFIVGPLYTTLPVIDYFSDPDTWGYLFCGLNLTFTKTRLPGVFSDSLFGLNGSLWSLHYEVICYLYLAIFGGLGLFSVRLSATFFCACVIIVAFVAPGLLPRFADNPASYMLPACFCLGILFAMNKRSIKIDLSRVILLWVFVWLFNEEGARHFLIYVALFYTAVYVGSIRFVVHRLRLPFDASYGIFVYGFMIQQCVHATFPNMGVHGNQCVSIILAVFVGVASWYLIEKSSIAFAYKLTTPKKMKSMAREDTLFIKKMRAKMLGRDKINLAE